MYEYCKRVLGSYIKQGINSVLRKATQYGSYHYTLEKKAEEFSKMLIFNESEIMKVEDAESDEDRITVKAVIRINDWFEELPITGGKISAGIKRNLKKDEVLRREDITIKTKSSKIDDERIFKVEVKIEKKNK